MLGWHKVLAGQRVWTSTGAIPAPPDAESQVLDSYAVQRFLRTVRSQRFANRGYRIDQRSRIKDAVPKQSIANLFRDGERHGKSWEIQILVALHSGWASVVARLADAGH